MTEIISVCSAQGCEMAAHCQNYRYVAQRPGVVVREWMPTRPGENCPDYEQRPNNRRWGDGKDSEAND